MVADCLFWRSSATLVGERSGLVASMLALRRNLQCLAGARVVVSRGNRHANGPHGRAAGLNGGG